MLLIKALISLHKLSTSVESIDTNIKVFRNRIFPSNTYLLISKATDCIVIDPGLDTQTLLSEIKQAGLTPIAVLSTHGHFDHIGSAANIQHEFKVPFYVHALDLKMLQSANFFLQVAKINHTITTPKPDFLFMEKQEELIIGDITLNVYNFPGHSNGSCIFEFQNYLFTGDILYKKGLGPESMPRENKKLLKESILEIISKFSDEHLVLPGHGSSAYLGEIKQNNLDLKNFISN